MLKLYILLVSLSSYVGTAIPANLVLIAMITYGIANPNKNLKLVVWLCILVSFLFTFLQYFYTFKNHIFSNSLFYFGFLLSLVCITKSKNKFNNVILNKNIFMYICILLLAEALINNLIPKALLNLVPVEAEQTNFFGFYQRPMGFAGNATMTACVIHMLWAIRQDLKVHFKFEYLYIVISTVVLASGFGIILLVIHGLIYLSALLLRRNARFFYLSSSIVFIFFSYLIFELSNTLNVAADVNMDWGEGFNKLDLSYLQFLFNLKKEQLIEGLSGITFLLIGDQHLMDISQTSGDFGYYNIISTVGFVGLFVLFIIPLSFSYRFKYFPKSFIFLFLSFLHYPGLLTPVGQFILSYFYFKLMYFKSSHLIKC